MKAYGRVSPFFTSSSRNGSFQTELLSNKKSSDEDTVQISKRLLIAAVILYFFLLAALAALLVYLFVGPLNAKCKCGEDLYVTKDGECLVRKTYGQVCSENECVSGLICNPYSKTCLCPTFK